VSSAAATSALRRAFIPQDQAVVSSSFAVSYPSAAQVTTTMYVVVVLPNASVSVDALDAAAIAGGLNLPSTTVQRTTPVIINFPIVNTQPQSDSQLTIPVLGDCAHGHSSALVAARIPSAERHFEAGSAERTEQPARASTAGPVLG
jgi:hypothetical protein